MTASGFERLAQFLSFSKEILGGGEPRFKLFFLFSVAMASLGPARLFRNLDRLGLLGKLGTWRSRGGNIFRMDFKSVIALYEIYTLNCYEAVPGFELRAGWNVVDAGANIGLFTIKAARTVGGSGRVLAFEPDPWAFGALMHNIGLNGAGNVSARNLALGERQETRTFGIPKNSLGGSLYYQGGTSVKVSTDTLDSEASRLNVASIDYMKIDVEGAELEVLEGTSEMLSRLAIKRVVVETHGDSLAVEAKKKLESFGYVARLVNVFPAFFQGHPFPTLYASAPKLGLHQAEATSPGSPR